MSLQLSDSVQKVRGVGPYYLKYLNKLGIFTIKDLLWHFPFRYEDFSHIKKISELIPGEKASLIASVRKINVRRSWHKKMFIIEAQVEDNTGVLSVIWFNQLYLTRTIKPGLTLSLSGKIQQRGKKLILSSPAFEIISYQKLEPHLFQTLKHTGRLVPIYAETKGLTSRAIRYLIKPLLQSSISFPDPLPSSIRKKYKFLPLLQAMKEIHFPSSLEMAQKAKNRFVFESLLLSQLYLLQIKKRNSLLPVPKIKLDIPLLKKFTSSLPYKLTNAQRKALWIIAQDLNKRPMNRLLEGEVGSGKTIVAMGASLLTLNSGYQVAIMAPTEILARQHFQTFKSFLQPFSPRLALLTSSEARIIDGELEGKISKNTLNKIISSSLPIIVIGTHALLQKKVKFANLGLIIVDEQHRFGVEQRKQLLANNIKKNKIPHLLSLTATPIPRTLALAFYGDLDLSILDELPKGRKKIITKVVLPRQRDKIYHFIKTEIQKGRQAFVICPRIEEKDKSTITASNLLTLSQRLNYEAKAVKKEYKKLSEEVFPQLRVGMLHGKMKPKEKEKIMKDFQDKKLDILVSTSVVEVGVDIPNASLMIIEGAEHFGLAQLHQFRGRVGRSHYQSYCFLFSEASSSTVKKRLQTMAKCNDGFRLAEVDLSLRGPGEFLGTKQSGLPDLVMRSLFQKELIKNAHQEAEKLLKEDGSLKKWPLLKKSLQEFSQKIHQNNT